MYKKIFSLSFFLSPILLSGCISRIDGTQLEAQPQTRQTFVIEKGNIDTEQSYLGQTVSLNTLEISSKI
jgi:hypothetical protein